MPTNRNIFRLAQLPGIPAATYSRVAVVLEKSVVPVLILMGILLFQPFWKEISNFMHENIWNFAVIYSFIVLAPSFGFRYRLKKEMNANYVTCPIPNGIPIEQRSKLLVVDPKSGIVLTRGDRMVENQADFDGLRKKYAQMKTKTVVIELRNSKLNTFQAWGVTRSRSTSNPVNLVDLEKALSEL